MHVLHVQGMIMSVSPRQLLRLKVQNQLDFQNDMMEEAH